MPLRQGAALQEGGIACQRRGDWREIKTGVTFALTRPSLHTGRRPAPAGPAISRGYYIAPEHRARRVAWPATTYAALPRLAQVTGAAMPR